MEPKPDGRPPTDCLRFVGSLPSLSRLEFGTGFIAHCTIGQIGDWNGIPVRDELGARPLAGIEEVAAPSHLARQASPSGGRVGINDPTVIIPFLRCRTVPSIVLIQAPSSGGLACRWHGDPGDGREHGRVSSKGSPPCKPGEAFDLHGKLPRLSQPEFGTQTTRQALGLFPMGSHHFPMCSRARSSVAWPSSP